MPKRWSTMSHLHTCHLFVSGLQENGGVGEMCGSKEMALTTVPCLHTVVWLTNEHAGGERTAGGVAMSLEEG